MSGNGEIKPPIKFYPMAVPALVAGAKVFGDNPELDSDHAYLLTDINFFQSIAKIFTEDEKASLKSKMWPGLLTEPKEANIFQYVDYVGASEEKKVDWGKLDQVSYDPDKKIDDCLPFLTFSKKTSGTASASYDSVWETVKKNLSPKTSIQQVIDSQANLKDSEKFSVFTELLELKRRWDYAMKMSGLDAYNPNYATAVADFEMTFKLYLAPAGSLNIQELQKYYAIRASVADKFKAIAGNEWVKSNLLPGAKTYFSTSIFNPAQLSIFDAIADLKVKIGELKKSQNPSKEKKLLADIKAKLDNMTKEYAAAQKNLGLVPGELIANEKKFNQQKEDADLLALSTLSKIEVTLDDANKIIVNAQQSPASMLDSLFNEFSSPFSSDPLSDPLSASLKEKFTTALKKPVGMVASITGINSFNRIKNRNNQRAYESKVDDKLQREKLDMIVEAKRNAERRSFDNSLQQKSAAQAQQRRQAETKGSKQDRSSEKVPNKKGR